MYTPCFSSSMTHGGICSPASLIPSTVRTLNLSFPGRTLIFQKGPEMEVRDDIRYFNHRINEILPTEVTDFTLPEDVAVEELKW